MSTLVDSEAWGAVRSFSALRLFGIRIDAMLQLLMRSIPTPHSELSPASCQTQTDANSALLTSELVSLECPRDSVTAGPQVWNSLPSALRAPGLTFDRFKRGLQDLSVYIGVMRSKRL